MSRATVRKVFVTGLVVFVVGAVIMALNAGGGRSASSEMYAIGLMLAGAGGVIAFVSWILALISSLILHSIGWFVVTLILGLIGLLPVIMIIYSLIGPTTRTREPRPTVA